MFERIITAPQVEPVTVEEVCLFSHLEVPGLDDGNSPPGPNLDRVLIQSYITSAREHVEQLMKRAMISQRWLLTFDCFPDREDYYNNVATRLYYPNIIPWLFTPYHEDSIEILRRPLQEEDNGSISPPLFAPVVVKYLDANGEEQTFDSANYIVFADRITLKPSSCWPTSANIRDAVRVEYPCGYGDTPGDVPERLKLATKFLAGHWFENRVPIGTEPTNEILMTLSSLLGPFKLYRTPR